MSRNPTPPNPSVPPGRVPPRPAATPAATPAARPATHATSKPPTAAVPGTALPRTAPAAGSGAVRQASAESVTPRKPASQAAPVGDAAPAPTPSASKPVPIVEGDIVARGSGDYRGRRYLMVILLVGMGAWFAYDGFKGWPEENRKIQAISDQRAVLNKAGDKEGIKKLDQDPLALKPPHSDKDLFFQKLLAFLLPGIGAATLVWALYNSRGEYRLSGKTLSVPGHPNVSLDSIVAIDRKDWDRKGIAYIEYRENEADTAAFDLDDFIYQREETDKIFEIVEAHVARGKKGAAGF